ncbi:MAG: TldD/PmbA family protein [Deinococcus sp.]|nr:TldD/PmbA family protein [Deinococcus sp.]
MRIRVLINGQRGEALASALDHLALEQAVRAACGAARLAKGPAQASFPIDRTPAPSVPTCFDSVRHCTPQRRAAGVQALVQVVERSGFRATGAFETEVTELAVANSQGVRRYAPLSTAHLRTVVTSPGGSGYWDMISRDLDAIGPKRIGELASERCASNQRPVVPEPGEYAAVLDYTAVPDLLRFFLLLSFTAPSVQEGRSFLAQKRGQQVLGQNTSIWDDGADPRTLALPFDSEGVIKRRVDFIHQGVAQDLAYDGPSAAKEQCPSTGHAPPFDPEHPWQRDPLPQNPVLGAGTTTREELIASTERGILVTRFHYTHCPDPTQVVATGMTRDGTFLIEQGKIQRACVNLRFTQSLVQAFQHVEALTSEQQLHRDWWGTAAHLVPALKVARFNFTGATAH